MTTTYFLNCVIGNVFKTKENPTLPNTIYLALSTTAPSVDGSGVTEPPASANYARVELNSLGEPSNGLIQNTSDISFNESSASWGTVTHFAIYDAPTNGNLLMYNVLSQSRSVETATIVMVKAGSLKFNLSNPA